MVSGFDKTYNRQTPDTGALRTLFGVPFVVIDLFPDDASRLLVPDAAD